MATLLLRAAGAAIGGLFGPLGAAIGGALGGIAGASLDQSLLAGSTSRSGPRLDSLAVLSSSEGTPVPRVYGSMRLGGQVIWATELQEVVSRRSAGSKGARQTLTEYSYLANFAVGLCEGPIASVRRIWADGVELDLGSVVWRLHKGGETQPADPLIIAKEGAANAPAYRGLAYIVFEGLPLADYGNRLPQLTFEILRPVGGAQAAIRAVNLIPGSGEFVYEDRVVTSRPRPGVSETLNRHMPTDGTDFTASLDDLLANCPNLQRVALVVSWFGSDLRAGFCQLRPAVEQTSRKTIPLTWSVAGQTRSTAVLVSRTADGAPAFGGTPTDESVLRAIAALKARGLAVTLYPFVTMDIPAANALPDPRTGVAPQPAYPWRGRITVYPAQGPASVDGQPAAAAQIATFFGSATPAQFSTFLGGVTYSGPAEWSYRRFILHYARLAELAGGVDAFVIGSELVGLTRVRSASGVYPAVQALVTLAQDVRSMVRPGTSLIYGADWTEYGAHVLAGGAEVRFPLDPLFAASAIDAVALDWYAPLADWRDGVEHLDARAGYHAHDLAYLRANIAGGEGFDWYYASDAARLAQERTPIADLAYGKPWIFRQKDLVGWWSNAHVERVGGVELATPTAWVPKSKPIWFLEFGCGAIDKGANRPSAFPDPASSEAEKPPFSAGGLDPLIQARVIEAIAGQWDPAREDFAPAANPLSPLYGGRMVDPARLYVWAWDARPFPAFPHASEVWRDGPNYMLGHWLNGRTGALTLDGLVAAVGADFGLDLDAADLAAPLTGAAIDRPMSARDVLEPLATLFGFAAQDDNGLVRLRRIGSGPVTVLQRDDLIDPDKGPLVERTRAEEGELPCSMTVSFADPAADYQSAVESSRRLEVATRAQEQIPTGLALARSEARRRIDVALQDRWIARETATFALPPSRLGMEPGDLVALDTDGRSRLYLVTAVTASATRQVTARRIEPAVFDSATAYVAPGGYRSVETPGQPDALFLALPAVARPEAALQWLAATAQPWPGALDVWRSSDGESFTFAGAIQKPATLGRLIDALAPGFANRWDENARLRVELSGEGDLVSKTRSQVLAGENLLAIQRPNGSVEMIQFAVATLLAPMVFELSGLLRGQMGTDGPADTLPAGSPVVLVDDALIAVARSPDDAGRLVQWRIGPTGRDIADQAMLSLTAMPDLSALQPYPPVQVRATRQSDGVRIDFLRRCRTGGDSWVLADVALGEDAEAYEIDILAGAAVKRTLSVTRSPALYPAAAERADFGVAQSQLTLRVFQMSATAGRGLARDAALKV